MTQTFATHLNSLSMFKQLRLEWMPELDYPTDYNWVPLESQIGDHSLYELRKLGDLQLNQNDRLNP
jgi:hypothetical protein